MSWTEFSFILRPSPISGIGIFATHDIPKGTRIFSGTFTQRRMKIADVPEAFHDYIVYLNDEECLAPHRFDCMEIEWYINHSDTPNISRLAPNHIVTIKDIKAGDEILLNYNELGEPDPMKKEYYAP